MYMCVCVILKNSTVFLSNGVSLLIVVISSVIIIIIIIISDIIVPLC
jgi:hypothetical protein